MIGLAKHSQSNIASEPPGELTFITQFPTTEPVAPVVGQTYWDGDAKWWNGTAWVDVGGNE